MKRGQMGVRRIRSSGSPFMVSADLIARYESLRRLLAGRFTLWGVEAALVDDEARRLDAELVALARSLPEDYRCGDESE